MDRITKNLLTEFVKENSLEKLKESTAFEHFSSTLLTASHYSESFSSFDVTIGSGLDCGIDGIAIIVNGRIVSDCDEVQELAERNGFIDATFILIQSETSSSFSTQKIGQFEFGILDIFSEERKLPQNDLLKTKIEIINSIYSYSSKFKNGNPNCYMYYVTTGSWVNDLQLRIRLDDTINKVKESQLFSTVNFECIDAGTLQNLYRQMRNSVDREIQFANKSTLPEMPDVEEAYSGFIQISEFLKLIQNERGELINSIFYDNVRDFQEWNVVNLDIKNTLEDKDKQILFPLLNNGITAVAKKVKATGNKFLIQDYQIVNGCQTSHVIHAAKDSLEPGLLVPIKLISTDNDEVKNQIIKATNRQTEVTEEQLFALSDLPKKLESYFPTFEGNKKLYYERRSRQYNSAPDIEKVRVINSTSLVRAFAATFLNLPHRTTRNYKLLQKSIGKDIFNKNHRLEMYYVSAFAYYKIEYLFRNQIIDSKLKSARYTLLMAFRYLATEKALPKYNNSNEMAKYCTDLMEVLWNDELSRSIFKRASDIILSIAGTNYSTDYIRTESFTNQLEKYLTK
ncbi:AIPR family protein [Brevibacillus laterosporus]|uniref:AIPR family protein n=1 Tax=Brevibacillus laterosporus TaxID=1465 RepID=UPI00215BDBBE|nr:AIPR family protein [Brevibacillus laterosporus]MCR8996177.1 AIPR family protein [Brevibacillus laterosporus]